MKQCPEMYTRHKENTTCVEHDKLNKGNKGMHVKWTVEIIYLHHHSASEFNPKNCREAASIILNNKAMVSEKQPIQFATNKTHLQKHFINQ